MAEFDVNVSNALVQLVKKKKDTMMIVAKKASDVLPLLGVAADCIPAVPKAASINTECQAMSTAWGLQSLLKKGLTGDHLF